MLRVSDKRKVSVQNETAKPFHDLHRFGSFGGRQTRVLFHGANFSTVDTLPAEPEFGRAIIAVRGDSRGGEFEFSIRQGKAVVEAPVRSQTDRASAQCNCGGWFSSPIYDQLSVNTEPEPPVSRSGWLARFRGRLFVERE